jgi:uncharacterized membrane protein YeiB
MTPDETQAEAEGRQGPAEVLLRRLVYKKARG